MIASIDTSLIDWSRAQFALTAMYHWLFVPLTLGLGVIQAIMETIYYKTGDEFWKKTAQFWMKLFGINFAIGVATGLILEFEFGTNWSNYSWFVGDIFGAPLAIEGILAFFMEATFIAVMFFGWDKVSKRFHLASTWLTIIGATLSALWILIANAWMQHPVGMRFNPDTVRNEMFDFWAVALSPVAINKFFHTVLSGWIVGAVFVIGISSWFLLKKRATKFALESIKVGAVFGLAASILIVWTGDGSAYQVAQKQPMKLAAMEGLYEGSNGTGLVAIGLLNPAKTSYTDNVNPFLFNVKIPKLLSLLAERDADAYVPGIANLIEGGYKTGKGTVALSAAEKIGKGRMSIGRQTIRILMPSILDWVLPMPISRTIRKKVPIGYATATSFGSRHWKSATISRIAAFISPVTTWPFLVRSNYGIRNLPGMHIRCNGRLILEFNLHSN